jgi:hypothetical protein
MSLLQGTEKQDEHGIKKQRVSQKQFSRRELVDEGARENVFACRFTCLVCSSSSSVLEYDPQR